MASDDTAYAAENAYTPEPAHVRSALTEPPERRGEPIEEAKSGPPTLVEWQNFVSRTVLKAITETWLYLCLGETVLELDQRELSMIALTREQYNEMSAPIASLANKSKFARKHGRLVISTTDSFNALLELGLWMNRVRRIARKHRTRPENKRQPVNGGSVNGTNGHGPIAPDGSVFGAGIGIFNPGTG